MLSPDVLAWLNTAEGFNAFTKAMEQALTAGENTANLSGNPFEALLSGDIGNFLTRLIAQGGLNVAAFPDTVL